MNPRYIIIRMPNWLGDSVMATPILRAVKNKWPTASLTVATPQHLAPLFYENPHVDVILLFKKGDLLREKYDLGILLTNSFSSAFHFWRSRVKERIGFSHEWRRVFLNKSLPLPKERKKEHLVETYKRLFQLLEIEKSDAAPELFLSEKERNWGREFLHAENATLIGINASAAYGPAKCWLPERFQEVTERLLTDLKTVILFFGDKASEQMINSICAPFKTNRVRNLVGKTSLRELCALIGACNLLLTNDSGPMHVAAALKTPLIALFGSTDEIATGPYRFGTIIHKHVECSPCFQRVCPMGHFKCMKKIEVEEVYQTILHVLKTHRERNIHTRNRLQLAH